MLDQLHTKNIKVFASFLGLLALLIFNGAFLYNNFNKVTAQTDWVAHTSEVMLRLDQTSSTIKDVQLGVRGYALAKSPEFLTIHQKGVLESWTSLRELQTLVAGSPAQTAATKTLQAMVEDIFKLNQQTIDRINRSQQVSPSELTGLFTADRIQMEAIRTKLDMMKGVALDTLEKRIAKASAYEKRFNWALALTTLLSLLLVSGAYMIFRKNQRRAMQEIDAKLHQAWIRANVADVANSIAGDLSVGAAAHAALKVLSLRHNILASKIFVLSAGKKLRQVASLATRDHFGSSATLVQEDLSAHLLEKNLLNEVLERDQITSIPHIPKEYWKITSSLGEATPQSLIFVPFSFQGQPIGVIELAAFDLISEKQLELFEILRETIGIGINAALSRESLQTLLETTQAQSEELQTQQEELKANNEELEQQARALESQQQSLNMQNRELEETRVQLTAKAEELQRSSRYKSEFLAKMSHELRTPLNGLLILSTLLVENKEKNLTDRQKQFAKSIHDAGRDLLLLISDILDLSKIEARKLSLKPEAFSVTSLLDGIKTTFEPQTDAKNLKLNLTVSEVDKDLRLVTDRQRLEQILRNFISNSLKFTEKGEITVRAEHDVAKHEIKFSVKDTGIGIPTSKQKLIFEAFEQADGSVSRQYGGTGLGLTISRELAALLGGRIELSSSEGEGSEFSITVPISLPHVEPISSPATRQGAYHTSWQTPIEEAATVLTASSESTLMAKEALSALIPGQRSILVVEDDDKFRSAVVEASRSHGFQPIEAGNGEVALAILGEHTPDAVLLDIKLPGISGLGLLEMIKQLPHLRHIPVHMISALDYQHNALRMGASGYLTKPVTMEKIKSALDRIENLISQKMRRLLLIEDDQRQRSAIKELISGDDVQISAAGTGKDAIELLKSTAFDCIILDLTLPDVSGFDLLEELNSLEISLPPIVIYTGKDLSTKEETYLRRFSESIIIKGARSPERLLDEVNLFLHRVESLLPLEKRTMLSNLRSQTNSFESKTVLLVDDDLRNVFALTNALEEKGLTVRIAKNGLEAVASIHQHQDIDLILMDIMMPKMNGFEAMEKIRASDNSRIKRIPIVALTAKAMREDHERCMEAGASDYLPKPINLDNLFTVLKVWLTPRDILA